MKLQRYTLAASTLVLLAQCLGADNPFARWDRIQQENTTPADSPMPGSASAKTSTVSRIASTAWKADSKKAAGTVEYFSPTSVGLTNSEAGAVRIDDSAGKVSLQQLRTGNSANPVAQAVGSQAAAPSTRQTPSGTIVERLPSVARTNTQTPAASNRVATAGFVQTNASSNVQQTSAVQFDEATDEDINPFAEFLNEQAAVGVEEDTPALPPMTETEEPEFAVPVVKESTFVAERPAAFAAKPAFHSNETTAAAQPGPQSPTVTVQWVYHGDFNLGQECRCDVVVENTGRSTVRNVVTEAVVPDGIEVVAASPAPTTTAGTATWSFGEMKPGQVRKIELTVVPQRQGELQMDAFVRITGSASSNVTVRQPMIALKLDGPPSIEVGQMVNYTAVVTNPGTGEAKNVVIQAVVPDGLEHRRGKMLTIEIGTLNPGESRQARLSLTGTQGGEHQLAVRVIADGGLNDQQIDTVAIAEPRLNIGVRGPTRGMAAQATDYEVIVVNEGKVDSNNVRAKYRIPEGFDFVKADRGGKFNADENAIDWFVGTLEPGQMKNFNVTMQANAPGEFKHQVGVISEHGRMTMAEHLTAVQGNARLSLNVASTSRNVQAGGEVSFEIKIQNSGTTAAESVGLSCELPAGLELLDISGPSEFLADSGVVIFRALPSLAGGESAVFVVKTRCTRAGSHSARVRVASESIGKALIDEETVTGVTR